MTAVQTMPQTPPAESAGAGISCAVFGSAAPDQVALSGAGRLLRTIGA